MPPFAHLNLTVADVERSEAFYARWFGFDQRPETYCDDTRFVRNRDDFDLAFLPGVPPSPPAPTVHFGFRTAAADEVRTLLAELRAAGVHDHRRARRARLRQPQVPRPRRLRDRGVLRVMVVAGF